MKKLICILLGLLIMAGAFSGCSFKSLKKESKQASNIEIKEDVQPTSSIMISEKQAKKQSEKIEMVLYFSNENATKLIPEVRFVSKDKVKNLKDMAKLSLEELFKGPISGNLVSPFPKGVKAPSVKLEKDMAIVDLSKEFVQKHPGGSTGEIMTVYSIVNTLTSIEGINSVKFTLDGKKMSEFKGHLDFSEPFKPDMGMVQQEQEDTSIEEEPEQESQK